jgi:hypothetical protein
MTMGEAAAVHERNVPSQETAEKLNAKKGEGDWKID